MACKHLNCFVSKSPREKSFAKSLTYRARVYDTYTVKSSHAIAEQSFWIPVTKGFEMLLLDVDSFGNIPEVEGLAASLGDFLRFCSC